MKQRPTAESQTKTPSINPAPKLKTHLYTPLSAIRAELHQLEAEKIAGPQSCFKLP